jgi:tetratricopeptide (TPR) repeat protein
MAAYLSYFSVRSARATYYVETQTLQGYERATQIEPGDARNWYLLGRYLQYSFDAADPQRSISSYQKALDLDPHATLTWLDLAAAYESEGNLAAARVAYDSARKSYPASAEVSWRYGNFLLRQGQLDQAFAEIRRSVQADPSRGAEAFSRCVRVEPNADVILDRALPVNRDVYLAVILDLSADMDVDNAFKVWKRLAAMHPNLRLPEIFELVRVLRESGRAPLARQVWQQAAEFAGLGQLEGPKNSAIWDGGFESDVTGNGYAWRIANGSRAQIGFDSQEKHSGKRSMRLSFDGSSDVAMRDVCQTVPAEGGTTYELSGWMQPKAVTTDQGVRIEVRPGTAESTVASTADARGTAGWTRYSAMWEGVKTPQEVEVCLRRDASDQEDNRIRGTVWVDDVALTPNEKSSAKK